MSPRYFAPTGGHPPQDQLLTDRAMFTDAYAVIPKGTMRDIVTSFLPFWAETRLWVLSRPLSGFAETFSQYIMEVAPGGGSDRPETDPEAEGVLFVVEGTAEITIAGDRHALRPGSYVYLPPKVEWSLKNDGDAAVRFHWLRKAYEAIDGLPYPDVIVTNEQDIAPSPMPGTDGKWATTRFVDPSDMRHDMHVTVVLEQVLANLEVAGLDLLLSALDDSRHHATRDLDALVHPDALQERRNPLSSEDPHEVVFERQEEDRRPRVSLSSATPPELVVDSARLVTLAPENVQTAEIENALAENDVGSATGHVRRDGDRPLLTRRGDDFRFAFVVLRVQNVVGNSAALEHPGEHLRVLDRDRSDEDRSLGVVDFLDPVDDRLPLLLLGAVDDVRLADALHRLVGRNRDDTETVDRLELLFLGLRGSGHTGDLRIQTEEVLERDRRESLTLFLDLQALFGLDRLVEPVRPAAPFHQSTGELVDDDNVTLFDDVVIFGPIDVVRTESLLDVVRPLHVRGGCRRSRRRRASLPPRSPPPSG